MNQPRRPLSSRERVAQLRAARRKSAPNRYLIPGLILLALATIAVARSIDLRPLPLLPGAPTASVRQVTAGGEVVPLTPELAPLPTLEPTAPPVAAIAPYAGPTAIPGSITRIPILMYHYVREVDAGVDPLGYGLSVTPANFAAQLDTIERLGYTPVTMDQALACLQGAAGCPPRPVALTFDDGYADAYSVALPLLRNKGFVATFYIVADFIGQPGYLTMDQIRELAAAGMEIGAHSVSHPDLTTLDEATARYEITESRQRLAAITGTPVSSFCYPAGRFNTLVRALVQEAGFSSAVTTIQSADFSDSLTLPRIRVDGGADIGGFEWLVRSLEL